MRIFLPHLPKPQEQVGFTVAAGAGWAVQGERIHGQLRPGLALRQGLVAGSGHNSYSKKPWSQQTLSGTKPRVGEERTNVQASPSGSCKQNTRLVSDMTKEGGGNTETRVHRTCQKNRQQVEGNWQPGESFHLIPQAVSISNGRRCCEHRLMDIRLR